MSYLYGEASESEALDFRRHLQQCDACRTEFTVFDQVHDSMQLWRSEALGASFDPLPVAEAPPFAQRERKLSALAALREFFTVAPLWLRGATAFAGLLLCVMAAMLFLRSSPKPVEVVKTESDKIYSQKQLQDEIKKAVDKAQAESVAKQNSPGPVTSPQVERHKLEKPPQVANNQPKAVHPRGLNRQEREQLAADLRLTMPVDEDESLLALPQQEIPNR